jgi:hypothetical protein
VLLLEKTLAVQLMKFAGELKIPFGRVASTLADTGMASASIPLNQTTKAILFLAIL